MTRCTAKERTPMKTVGTDSKLSRLTHCSPVAPQHRGAFLSACMLITVYPLSPRRARIEPETLGSWMRETPADDCHGEKASATSPHNTDVLIFFLLLSVCLTSTETSRLIRDRATVVEEGGRKGGRLYIYCYTATTRMTPALRWAAMRAVLKFH